VPRDIEIQKKHALLLLRDTKETIKASLGITAMGIKKDDSPM
jgi:hypothetical protein